MKIQKKYLLQGYYLLLFKKINTCRIDGSMMSIVFQREQCSEGVEEAKKGAMYWIKVWGEIDSENVIPYSSIVFCFEISDNKDNVRR